MRRLSWCFTLALALNAGESADVRIRERTTAYAVEPLEGLEAKADIRDSLSVNLPLASGE